MRRLLTAALVAASLAAIPSTPALADAAPLVKDGCGDADKFVQVGSTVIGTQDTQRASGFDVDAIWLVDAYDTSTPKKHIGVDVILQMCGTVPAPELFGSGWGVHVALPGPCGRSLYVNDAPREDNVAGGIQRRASMTSWCTRSGTLLPNSFETYEEWTEELPASSFSVAGKIITWRLRTGMLPTERADRVAFLKTGTTLSHTGGYARDGRKLTEASQSGGPAIDWHVSGPGAYDTAGNGADFVVGAGGQ